MILFAVAVGALGVLCLAWRQTLLGVLIGLQLLSLGGGLFLVLSGVIAGVREDGQVAGLLIAIASLGQLVAGLAVATRLFYLKGRSEMKDLRALKG